MPSSSIIIPVYNTARYLRECLDSVLAQDFKDVEIICINDGSTDGSLKILEEFQEKDRRIQIITQQNKGVAAARNAGLAVAQGKYIGFVDSDDRVERYYFRNLLHAAEKFETDITVADFLAEINGKTYLTSTPFAKNRRLDKKEIQQELFPELIKSDSLNSCWNKLFKASLIKNHNVLFPVGITVGEDAAFVREAFTKAQSAVFTPENGYFYRETQGSASRNILGKNYLKYALLHYNDDFAELGSALTPDQISELKSVRLVHNLIALVSMVYQSSGSEQSKYEKVREIVNTAELQNSLLKHWDLISKGHSGFTLFLMKNMKKKNILMLSLACKYANFRNRK